MCIDKKIDFLHNFNPIYYCNTFKLFIDLWLFFCYANFFLRNGFIILQSILDIPARLFFVYSPYKPKCYDGYI